MRKMRSVLSLILSNAILPKNLIGTSNLAGLNKILAVITLAFLTGACAHVATTPVQSDNVFRQEESNVTDPHLVISRSVNNFETTLAQVINAIDKRGFKTFAVIDHSAGAASIGQTLRPTTLIIFGNPVGGTPLMLSVQTMGIELPLKILVYEDEDGAVAISYPDMAYIFEAHGVNDRAPVLQKIQGALGAIAAEGAE